jgi:2-methylisocitrate lyase-like PEP mutase family enzyme
MPVTQNEKALRFRRLHDGPGAFVIPNPWDIGSARILAGLGFQALATSSAAAATAVGRRDGRLTRDEALAHARLIVDATDLPVSADLEKGFGDAPEVVAETIRLRLMWDSLDAPLRMLLAIKSVRFTMLVWPSNVLLQPRKQRVHCRSPSS